MKNDLLDYFVEQTDKKIDALVGEVKEIKTSLQDLAQFKVQMMVSSRWVSLIISAICGLATFIGTIGVTIYLSKSETKATEVSHTEKMQ